MTDDWEAVLWDIGGVIVDLESVAEAQRSFVERFVEAYDVDAPVEDALAAWREAVGAYFREREGTEFRPARDAYVRGVAALLGEHPDDDAWRDLLRESVAEHRRAHPGARETIARLAGTDLHLGVVSDIDEPAGERALRELEVREHFDAITTSEEVGRTKPDPAMFEAALEKAGSDPGRTLMIGDRYEHDMRGAADCGIRTAAFGAEDGPAVDYVLEDLADVLRIVGVDAPGDP